MKKILFCNGWSILISLFLLLGHYSIVLADASSANGQYSGLLQKLHCPADQKTYGEYRNYGYWGGGAWCGQTGVAGYWVWQNPNWYVWKDKLSAKASANGKYSNLLQTLKCRADRNTYGVYRDYGYWKGGAWCGQTGVGGYWVWVYPNWYVWQTKR